MTLTLNKFDIAKAVLDSLVVSGKLEGGVDYWCTFNTTEEFGTGGMTLSITRKETD
jgi:hypothetical protein